MYRKGIVLLFLCSFFIIAGCKEDVQDNSVSAVPLVDTLSNGESFQFRGIEWFISEDEVLLHEGLTKDNIEVHPEPTKFRYPTALLFEEVGLTVGSIIYNFHDDPNMLVSGEYIAFFDDEETFQATFKKVSQAFDSAFNSITNQSTEDLEVILDHADGSKSWHAADNSFITLSHFIQRTSPIPFTIQIKVHAPKEIKRALP